MTYMAKKLCQWTAEVYDLANMENSSFAHEQSLPFHYQVPAET